MDLQSLLVLLEARFPKHIQIFRFENSKLKKIHIQELPKINIELTDDSRNIKQNSFFFSTYFAKPYLLDAIEKKPLAIWLTKRELKSLSLKDSSLYLITGKKTPDFYLGHSSSIYYLEPSKDQHIVAITGTNGKTTISFMIYHLWKKKNIPCAVIGTLGVYIWDGKRETHFSIGFTTPRAYELQKILYTLKEKKICFVVMEASSEALALKRLEGLYIEKAIFTNLTQDHLDFHKTMNHYLFSKLHLFFLTLRHSQEEHPLIAVYDPKIFPLLKRFTSRVKTKIVYIFKSHLTYAFTKQTNDFEFNQYNALCAYYGCLTKNIQYSLNESPLIDFKGVAGRMEKINWEKNIDIFIDYAHTPDALKNVLIELRKKYTYILTVFGCGGNRDKEKRPQMGKIASLYSNYVFITDDNPRMENPEQIRKEILAGIPKDQKSFVYNIPDREEAIKRSIQKGLEILETTNQKIAILIAGKGHEEYQIIKNQQIPFSDKQIVLKYLH